MNTYPVDRWRYWDTTDPAGAMRLPTTDYPNRQTEQSPARYGLLRDSRGDEESVSLRNGRSSARSGSSANLKSEKDGFLVFPDLIRSSPVYRRLEGPAGQPPSARTDPALEEHWAKVGDTTASVNLSFGFFFFFNLSFRLTAAVGVAGVGYRLSFRAFCFAWNRFTSRFLAVSFGPCQG